MEATLLIILALVAIGGIASLVLLVRAFQVSAWWGVASILIPFAQTVFGLCHFSRAKYSFLIMHFSFLGIIPVLMFGGIPMSEEGLTNLLGAKMSASSLYSPEELTSEIQEKRVEIEQLEGQFHTMGAELSTQFAALNKKRTALKAGDSAAIEQFNVEAAAYDAKNKAHKSIAEELETVRKELQELLDERSRRPKRAAN